MDIDKSSKLKSTIRFVLFSLAIFSCLNTNAQNVSKVSIVNFDGLEPLLTLNNDTTYVVNFWATWCGPCVKELPYFEQLHEDFKDEKIKILLVSLDFKKQVETKLIPFMNKHQLKSEVIVLYDPDADTWINKVSDQWSGALPGTLIFSGGKRQFFEQTFHNQKELNHIIKPYLNTKP